MTTRACHRSSLASLSPFPFREKLRRRSSQGRCPCARLINGVGWCVRSGAIIQGDPLLDQSRPPCMHVRCGGSGVQKGIGVETSCPALPSSPRLRARCGRMCRRPAPSCVML